MSLRSMCVYKSALVKTGLTSVLLLIKCTGYCVTVCSVLLLFLTV